MCSNTEDPKVDVEKIGQVFVMHYYTQMHKDPSQLYRFYLDHSVYTRGGPEKGTETPVVGQKAIDEKILSLGLQHVHTKIRQVDCHETVSNNVGPGIIVQVTGELSNAGYPMRPFVQTFVLARESATKYYVHNDIFRYQIYDEDFVSESDTNETTPPQPSDLDETQSLLIESNVVLAPPTSLGETREDEIISDHSVKGASPAPPTPLENPLTNSWDHPNDHYESSTTDVVMVQSNGLPEETPVESSAFPVMEDIITTPTAPPTTSQVNEESEASNNKPTPNPTSWAAKLKTSSSNVQSGNKSYSSQQPRSTNNVTNSTANSQQPLPQREPKQPSSSRKKQPGASSDFAKSSFEQTKTKSSLVGGMASSVGGGGSSFSSLSRTTPDSHQIFVGNLPSETTEEELKDVFKKYGNIIEVRINPKNFGFIVFDGQDPVQTIMGSRSEAPVMLHDRRLNIEEKRPSSYPKGNYQSGSNNFNSSGNFRMFGGSAKTQRGGVVSGSKAPPRR